MVRTCSAARGARQRGRSTRGEARGARAVRSAGRRAQSQSSGSTGVGDVQIVSDTGAVVTLSNGFDYKTAGVITTVSPPTGQVGTIVTITGTTLRGSADRVAQVTLANEAASVTSEVDTTVVVVAPQSAAKNGDVPGEFQMG